MPSASAIRVQVESALAHKIPAALTPVAKMVRPVVPSGIEPLDAVLQGGFPVGAVSEVIGPECSGRTSLAHSFVARVIESGKVAAWIDVSDTFDAASAAAAGIDLRRLLWVRCGVTELSLPEHVREFTLPDTYLIPSTPKRGLHGGGCGTHPRQEAKALSNAVSGLLQADLLSPRCAESQRKARPAQITYAPVSQHVVSSASNTFRPRSVPEDRTGSEERGPDPASGRVRCHRARPGKHRTGIRVACRFGCTGIVTA